MTGLPALVFCPKDFIETAEGLLFAVVAHGLEQGKVLCFLRYVSEETGWKKYATVQANALLARYYPEYLYYSEVLDAHLHAVSMSRIVRHYQPRQRLQAILHTHHRHPAEQDLFQLCTLLQQSGIDLTLIGITGSLLVGTQTQGSDIDLVCYTRQVFQHCRTLTGQLIGQGRLQDLSVDDWRHSFERRSCALSFSDYVWHERRKFNKALINARKFDLSFIDPSAADAESVNYQKCGSVTIRCQVTDDSRAFDYPAEYKIAHNQIGSVVSYTATYAGQACAGEMIEVCGFLEQAEHGELRIVVGATREAHDEYIKVVSD